MFTKIIATLKPIFDYVKSDGIERGYVDGGSLVGNVDAFLHTSITAISKLEKVVSRIRISAEYFQHRK